MSDWKDGLLILAGETMDSMLAAILESIDENDKTIPEN